MVIEFFCASCGHRIVSAEETRGEEQRCPNPDCGRIVRVPDRPAFLANEGSEHSAHGDLIAPGDFPIETSDEETRSRGVRQTARLPTEDELSRQRSRHVFWTMEGVFLLSLITTILLSDRALFHNNLGGVLARFFGFILCYTLLLVEQGLFVKFASYLHNALRNTDEEQVSIPPLETAMLIGFLSIAAVLTLGFPLRDSELSMGVRVLVGTGLWTAAGFVSVKYLLTDEDHQRATATASLVVASLTQALNLAVIGLLVGGYVAGQQWGWW